ncbi:hypothetical protein P691DRAFT_761926 [Macrolepiota fuliginosa MF-IS2]|uniref:DUF6534 domain-containing protein n=1 Tax=Macrolepiota fuliginosa MF-IS2 TaxID=1400762 RepID=A0A9P5X743_9AGAR|nr:hypothetical protein P691DRAFT_761926 [Macrolepiota fuliginosa MF-IS2]
MPSPPPPPHSPHEMEQKNGPIFIGFTVDCLLFGLLIAQICKYLRGYKWHRDGIFMRSIVYFVCTIELFRLIIVVQSVWGLVIELRAPPGWVASSTPLAVALPSLAGFESAIVQIFFAWRIWSLRRGESLYWAIAVLTVMTAGGEQQLSAAIAQALDPKGVHEASLFTTVWLVGSFVCDMFIVFAMAIILVDVRKEATFRETEKLIDCLLRLTIETGALTVLAAAVMLGLHLKYTTQTYYLGILYILGGLYTNILLYVLNSRDSEKSRHPLRHNEISLHLASTSRVAHTASSISQPPELEGDDLTSQRRDSKD